MFRNGITFLSCFEKCYFSDKKHVRHFTKWRPTYKFYQIIHINNVSQGYFALQNVYGKFSLVDVDVSTIFCVFRIQQKFRLSSPFFPSLRFFAKILCIIPHCTLSFGLQRTFFVFGPMIFFIFNLIFVFVLFFLKQRETKSLLFFIIF